MRYGLPTAAEKKVQYALNGLWMREYTKPHTTAERIKITEDFAEQWLDRTEIKLDKPFIVHPETMKKVQQRTCTVAEVLADFVLRIDQVAEKRNAEYPISGQARQVRTDGIRRKRELSIVYQFDIDEAEESGEGFRTPPYSILETDFNENDPVESELFADRPPTVKAFRRQLERAKANAHRYATKYADRGYDFGDSVRRIRRLDPDRVRECRECGEPFYAHDLRRVVCDLQHGRTEKGVRSPESTCELNSDKRNSAKNRNKSDKTA